ncbi:Uncharacterised protein [Segatella copri]|nr:Uncharacterised protein [Segatella copri]
MSLVKAICGAPPDQGNTMTVIPVGTSLSNKRQSTLIRTNLRPSFGGQLE